MNWKQWKRGLLVAAATGLFSCIAVNFVDPAITWAAIGKLCLAFVAKDVLLYLKDHSVVNIDDGEKPNEKTVNTGGN